MGAVDFRVGGHIFATLASVKQGYGNLMLTPEVQAQFVADAPDLFLPDRTVAGDGWAPPTFGSRRPTPTCWTGALRAAWKLRIEKNAPGRRRRTKEPVRRVDESARRVANLSPDSGTAAASRLMESAHGKALGSAESRDQDAGTIRSTRSSLSTGVFLSIAVARAQVQRAIGTLMTSRRRP